MKKEKKPIQEQVRDDVTMLEKINMLKKRLGELEKDNNAYKQSGEEKGNEIASLKRQIGGYKAANSRCCKDLEKYKGEVSRLHVELDKAKAYGKEADELNEKKAEQIASLNATVEEKDRVIDGLQSQIAELNKRIANDGNNIQDLTVERDVAIANYDYICSLPWYKRAWFNPNASKNVK